MAEQKPANDMSDMTERMAKLESNPTAAQQASATVEKNNERRFESFDTTLRDIQNVVRDLASQSHKRQDFIFWNWREIPRIFTP